MDEGIGVSGCSCMVMEERAMVSWMIEVSESRSMEISRVVVMRGVGGGLMRAALSSRSRARRGSRWIVQQ